MSTISIVALIGFIGIVIAVIGWINAVKKLNTLEKNLIEVSDVAPKEVSMQSVMLQLSNEIYPYVKVEDDKVSVTVLKK